MRATDSIGRNRWCATPERSGTPSFVKLTGPQVRRDGRRRKLARTAGQIPVGRDRTSKGQRGADITAAERHVDPQRGSDHRVESNRRHLQRGVEPLLSGDVTSSEPVYDRLAVIVLRFEPGRGAPVEFGESFSAANGLLSIHSASDTPTTIAG